MSMMFKVEAKMSDLLDESIQVFNRRERDCINHERGCWDADDRAAAWYMLIGVLNENNDPRALSFYKESIQKNVWSAKFSINGKNALRWKESLDKIFKENVEQKSEQKS
jgi:hypothetical protein